VRAREIGKNKGLPSGMKVREVGKVKGLPSRMKAREVRKSKRFALWSEIKRIREYLKVYPLEEEQEKWEEKER
jgi:hypothetical protein